MPRYSSATTRQVATVLLLVVAGCARTEEDKAVPDSGVALQWTDAEPLDDHQRLDRDGGSQGADGSLGAGGDAGQPGPSESDASTPASDTGSPGPSVPGTWVTIPAGSFTMGAPPAEPCSGGYPVTQHEVTLTRALEMQTTEVTKQQFKELMGYVQSYFGASTCPSCPVEWVTWHEMAAYCNALSTRMGLARCYQCSGNGESVTCVEATGFSGSAVHACPGYRLPTEAEWEYAYRAGTTTAYYSGPNTSMCIECSTKDPNLDAIGWYCANSGQTTHPVGQKTANNRGLYDMTGNVREWCHDGWQNDLGADAVTNPLASGTGLYRTIRGGSWQSFPSDSHAAARFPLSATVAMASVGGRCVRTLAP